MIIVKIFPSSPGFDAIYYNERKNDLGKSALLDARNFEGLGHIHEELVRSDYVNYIKMVAGLNRKVQNRQFHAVISTKGRTRTPEALRDIAVRYLDKMGYGKSPSLIYVHFDTANTHVHMVSAKIDKSGKRINSSFDWTRSNHAIQEILQENPRQEASAAIAKALEYNFSSLTQFKLVLAQEGFKVRSRPGELDVIKYGKAIAILPKRPVEAKINAYVLPGRRVRQLKALFYTYMPGLKLDGFTAFLQKKFGIEVVLHQLKKKGEPKDYSIIDNGGDQREVLKGDQVMPLTEVSATTTNAEKLAKAKTYIQTVIQKETAFSELKNEMSTLGFEISSKGVISVNGEMTPTLRITRELLKRLKYNERVVSAEAYACAGGKEVEVLARLFMVDTADLRSNLSKTVNSERYYSVLENIIESNKTDDILASLDTRLVKFSGNFFLIDEKEKAVVLVDKRRVKHLDLNAIEKLEVDQKAQGYSRAHPAGEAFDRYVSDYSAPPEKRTKKLSI